MGEIDDELNNLDSDPTFTGDDPELFLKRKSMQNKILRDLVEQLQKEPLPVLHPEDHENKKPIKKL